MRVMQGKGRRFECAPEEVVVHVELARKGVGGVVDGVLQVALLLAELGAERLERGVVGGGGELGLEARLQRRLRLRHQVRPRLVPRGVLGGRDRHGRAREVAHLDLALHLLLHCQGKTNKSKECVGG